MAWARAKSSDAILEIVGAVPAAAMTLRPKAWKVETVAPFRSSGSRSLISPAAFWLKVRARTALGSTPWFLTRWAILPMMTAVLPVPAPASTRVASSSVAMALACSVVSPLGRISPAAACTMDSTRATNSSLELLRSFPIFWGLAAVAEPLEGPLGRRVQLGPSAPVALFHQPFRLLGKPRGFRMPGVPLRGQHLLDLGVESCDPGREGPGLLGGLSVQVLLDVPAEGPPDLFSTPPWGALPR